MIYCLTLIINISLRTLTCPELNKVFPIAIPKSPTNIFKGEFPIKEILYKPKGYYNKPLPSSKIGDFVICLDIPSANTCIHGWNDTSVLGKAVSSECYRMSFKDMKDLWMNTSIETTVIIKN